MGEARRFFDEVVLVYDGDDCLIWPFAKTTKGRAKIGWHGKATDIPNLLCQIVHGAAPPGHEAAHSCGNGHTACVTKRHLRWKTHAANMKEMIDHGRSTRGTQQANSKLTETEVRQILALRGSLSQGQIASMFNVCPSHVGRIQRGDKWGWFQ